MEDIVKFFAKIDKTVRDLSYGNVTGNTILKNGLAVDDKVSLVISRRKKYMIGKDKNYVLNTNEDLLDKKIKEMLTINSERVKEFEEIWEKGIKVDKNTP
jgi:hypothetical protein